MNIKQLKRLLISLEKQYSSFNDDTAKSIANLLRALIVLIEEG